MAELNADGAFGAVCVAVGVFDGMHRGHQRVVERLLAMARAAGARPVVVTFAPHPRSVLHPHAAPALLAAPAQKARLLREAGVDGLVLLPFDRAMAALPPEPFLAQHLQAGGVAVRGICVGAGWRFGAGGAGDVRTLRQYGRAWGFRVAAVPELPYYGRPVSSTRIRHAVAAGNLGLVRRLLGRDYAVEGTVAHGQGRGGAEFACPTANLVPADQLLPPSGVYAVEARLDPDAAGAGAAARPGIAYIGRAPTLLAQGAGHARPVLETHLFDYAGELYGRTLEVAFLEFIRPEQVFPSPQALREQIACDTARARTVATGVVPA